LNIGKFPILPFVGLASIVLLAVNLDPLTILLGFIILGLAVPVYYILKKIWKLKS